jgi:excisionase family DNA binding protein
MSTTQSTVASSDTTNRPRFEAGFSLANRVSFTIDEASAATGLTKRQIEGAIQRGELKHRVVGRTALIAASALRKLVGEES